jgi:hypothetical protein
MNLFDDTNALFDNEDDDDVESKVDTINKEDLNIDEP